MNEDEIVSQLLDELQAATDPDVDVRTIGGDTDSSPPEVILDWSSVRLPTENGHNPFGAYKTDESGNQIGVEYHAYFRMDVDCVVRYYDEEQRDITLDDLHITFLPYEYDSGVFHDDTAEWRVGTESPRQNPVLEPDWYEIGFLVQFKYIKRASDTETYGTLESVDDTVEVDDTLEESSAG